MLVQGLELSVNTSQLTYLPTIGFRGKESFEGKFVCRQGNRSASITAFTTSSSLNIRDTFEVVSKHTRIRISKYHGVIEINCTSPTSKAGLFSVQNDSLIRLSQSWAGAKGKAVIEVVVDTSGRFATVSEAAFPTNISCLLAQDEQMEVIHLWTIQLDSMGLYGRRLAGNPLLRLCEVECHHKNT